MSVYQSYSFTSTHNKLTKMGSNFARKILYTLVIAFIKTLTNDFPDNPILIAYYKKLTQSKPKKVSISTVMHKLINHFLS